jgi:CRISPR-associated protein Csb1
MELSAATLDRWATDPKGPVALHLKQHLLPVEVDGKIVFPPTYADVGYNIDDLLDGTKVVTIDSVGSQANRIEPMFRGEPNDKNPLAELVPQLEIVLHGEKGAADRQRRSIFDLAHRSGDAVVQASPTLSGLVAQAFESLRNTGDAGPLCALAPTSLVFGVWDSRGGTGEKRPRLVRATIRAWDVERLHAAAQFSSVWKALGREQQDELKKEAAKRDRKDLSEVGLADAPATFRKTDKIPQFRDGAPNPEARVLGGVLVKGRIERDVTVNLIALRGLRGGDDTETQWIQKYLLGLSLLAATAEIDLFLREGCHLRYDGADVWHLVPRRGEPSVVDLGSDKAQTTIHGYASTAADHFRSKWPKDREHRFDLKEAMKLLAKKDEATPATK